MKRDLGQLASNRFDLLVIGGGIYGAWTAWDAALRGMSVALVDKRDFASATSSNSLKIIHGGIRYLQHGDFRRMREFICERRDLMGVAPHLVHPLPVLIPAYGGWMQRREVMGLALTVNDVIGVDRNRLDDPQKHIPRGQVLSRREVQQLVPDIPGKGLTGGMVFYDAQVYNSERLVISILRSAANAGAVLGNYVEVTGFLREGDTIRGVVARDVSTWEPFEVRASVTINATGPWNDDVLRLGAVQSQNGRNPAAKAVNIVTRSLARGCAVGIPSNAGYLDTDAVINKGDRFLFIAPWRGHSLIGTTYAPYQGDPDDLKVCRDDVENLLEQFNRAWPSARLNLGDVFFVHGGLLPSSGIHPTSGDVQLAKHFQIRDHRGEGVQGLISVTGVKYTTARKVAEKAVDLVFQVRGQKAPKSATAITPIYGGDIGRFAKFLETEAEALPGEGNASHRLLHSYGSAYRRVLDYLDEDVREAPWWVDDLAVWQAEVRHGVREEMAQKLGDVIFRRTELGTAGHPGRALLTTCAETMGAELGWSTGRVRQEVQEVEEEYLTASIKI